MEKKLPHGVWLYFNRLAVETTDVSLQEFLASRGIDLPLENISVRVYQNCACGKVAIPHGVVEQLLNWAIDKQQLHGRNAVASYAVHRPDQYKFEE